MKQYKDNSCKLKHIQPNINGYVGNVKLKHLHASSLLTFMTKLNINIIMTLEGDKSEEHIHFYIPELPIQVESLKKYLRKEFPELKRPVLVDSNGKKKKGGAVLTRIKHLKESLQYYYIFKEYHQDKKRFYLSNYATPYSHKTLKQLKLKYDLYKEAKLTGKKGKFLYWLLDNDKLTKDPVILGLHHLDYQREINDTYITFHNTCCAVNYVLNRRYPQTLQNLFQIQLQKKYENNI